MYECSQCGAQLRFDIQTQLLHCDHCGADFNPETFQPKDAAEESKDAYGVTVFRCRQCGAELVSTTNSAVGFCIYCGAQNMLESRLETRNRPARIIPFHLTKDDCREVYRKKIRNALYAPRELRDTKELEKFRGIYVPYWVYDADFNQSVQIPASEQVQNGDYIVDSDYQVTVTIHGGCHGIACDASSSFDDHVAEMIAPYSAKKMVPFNPAYLAGFYADTADVPAETYAEWAADFATEQAMDAVRKRVNTGNVEMREPASGAESRRLLGTRIAKPEAALFPVWFLTWRKKDRVAYAIVNGDTGKVSMDMPVDRKRFFMGCAVSAAVFFVIFAFLFSMTAPDALFWCSVIAMVSGILYFREMRQIAGRETHEEDPGYFAAGRNGMKTGTAAAVFPKADAKAAYKREAKRLGRAFRRTNPVRLMIGIWILIGFLLPSFSGITDFTSGMLPGDRAVIGIIPAGIVEIVFFFRTIGLAGKVKEKSMIPEALSALGAALIAILIAVLRPVSDLFWYIGCIASLLAVLVTSLGLISKYNILATRPIPTFFDREGGNDSAKD